MGYSQKWTQEIARRYDSEGVEGLLGDRRHANPGAKERALLDEEGQAELRAALLLEEAPPGGGMCSGPKVARWIERRNGFWGGCMPRAGLGVPEEGAYEPAGSLRPSNAKGASASEREAFKKVFG